MKKNNPVLEFLVILLVGGSLMLAIVDKKHRAAFVSLTELAVITYIGVKNGTASPHQQEISPENDTPSEPSHPKLNS